MTSVNEFDLRLPEWLKKKALLDKKSIYISKHLGEKKLHSVCHEARCPNRNECFSSRTATFLILGSVCTRNCLFCGVEKGKPGDVDKNEPRRIGDAARDLGLKYVVLTSVTRDDLQDGGAKIFTESIREIRNKICDAAVEILVPDFRGRSESINIVIEERPEVFNHNIETVPSLYSRVRPGADYKRSLKILETAKEKSFSVIKTGLILGLGERVDELRTVFRDLSDIGVEILTMGQYLRPSLDNIPVFKYITPDEFIELKEIAVDSGIKTVISGPLVRSSYRAKEAYFNIIRNK